MKYCKNCILPDTRPNLNLDKKSSLCSVCKSIKLENNKINWKKRESDFKKLINTKLKNHKGIYDCLIPVSGGKDSTWQVINALKYNLRPLCVSWKSPARSDLGQKNLENLKNLGVDHIDFSINPKLEKYFTLKTFKKFGNPLIPMHMALHAITVRTAIEKNIKLIFWGENAADEYGGKKEVRGKFMTNEWRKFYGVTNGTSISFWFDKYLNKKNTFPYKLPDNKEIKKSKITEIFLGHFFKWDPIKSFKIAKKYGFKEINKPKTGIYSFADIDDKFLITVHHYMKWYKFGFNRTWDNLSIEIRKRRITRKKAIKNILRIGRENPKSEIEKFCKYLGITKKSFFQICNNLRNKKIWKRQRKNWYIKGFLIKNWKWNESKN